MLPPRGLGESTFRIASHTRDFLLSSAAALCKTLQKTSYGVQRNIQCQLYAARRLDAIGHGTLSPKGIPALQQCWLLAQNHGRNSRLASEDQFDNCFGIIDCSIPTLGGTSTDSKSCVSGTAASCGTMATTNNSTSNGCAFETPAGTTSGGEGALE
jgi:H2-forming N5,N10-methylenetetrahydromethanopterin dehydrogenase-like enzyme